MSEEENLYDSIYGSQYAQYDQSAKRLVGDRQIAARVLKRVAKEYKDIPVRDIADRYIIGNPFISEIAVFPDETNASRKLKKKPKRIAGRKTEAGSVTEGTVTFDVLFDALVPGTDKRIRLIINIEAQKTQSARILGYALLKRATFYGARLISSQKETEFTGVDYDNIQKVYVVFICMDSPTGQSAINRYEMKEKHLLHRYEANEKEYDLLNIVMIYLADDKTRDKLIQLMQILFRGRDKSATEKQQELQKRFDIELNETSKEELRTMCNLGEGLFESAFEQGIEQTQIRSIKNLMETMKISAQKAMELLKIPLSDQKRLLASL